jgi:hypothetical protein
MVGHEELLCALMTFGRRNLQDVVARSRDVRVTASYLSAELNLELARAISFKTTDLVTFQRKMTFRYQPNQISQHYSQR